MILNNLLSQKMALESQWNSMYTNTGIYTIEMKAIEKRIDEIKSQLVIADIQKAKSSS
tara:strand:+ start:89 stop:262 length:174 start_codon:yes stop_codon:yes gene_type:complete